MDYSLKYRPICEKFDSVRSTFKEYNITDCVDELRKELGRKPYKPYWRPEPLKKTLYPGIYLQIRDALCPPQDTEYQLLIRELKETTQSSSWRKQLGAVRDPVPGLPVGMASKRYDITFGHPLIRGEKGGELINPPLSHYQVLSDSQKCHDWYRKTHNDYNLNEKVNRNYISPPYDPNKRYGMRTKVDRRGLCVARALTWFKTEPISFRKSIQSDQDNKKCVKINPASIPHRAGVPTKRPYFGMGDLLKDYGVLPQIEKRRLLEWMDTYNRYYRDMKQKLIDNELDMDDMRARFKNFDHDKSDKIDLCQFYFIVDKYYIANRVKNIEPLMRFFKIIEGDQINYMQFIQITKYLFDLPKIEDVPKDHQYYDSIVHSDYTYPCLKATRNLRAAGVRATGELTIKAERENEGAETSAGNLLNPCIYQCYGLSFKDFFKPREPEVIRPLFEKIGYKLDDETFKQLWNMGMENDQTGMVCINTFYELVKQWKASQTNIDTVQCSK